MWVIHYDDHNIIIILFGSRIYISRHSRHQVKPSQTNCEDPSAEVKKDSG